MTPESITVDIKERFFARFTQREGCWEWRGHLDKDGYGQIRVGGRRVAKAHRVSWLIHFGRIPNDLSVLHSCDNPPCVRPDHLWLGTLADNNSDRDEKGRGRWLVGSKLPQARLNETLARSIFNEYREGGITERQLANQYGVTQSAIHMLLAGITWKHLNLPVHDIDFTATQVRGSKQSQAKITEAIVKEIRNLYASGKHSQQAIAEKFGIYQTQVSNIVRGTSWVHVK